MMVKYELWLDESGQFEDEKIRSGESPSLVGGILFKQGDFSKKQARALIGKTPFHSTEKKGREEIAEVHEKFKRIAGENVTFIEISNDERIHVMDSNLTYQNIMAEGLIQIIRRLKREHGDEKFKVDILIAKRGDCTSENKSKKPVSAEQYKDRIKERMILKGYAQHIPDTYWSIEIADAKTDERLMVADIVCNSFLTQNTKFKGEMGDYINSVRKNADRTWLIPALETSFDHSINQLLLEERLGEAVVCLCQSDNANFIKKKSVELGEAMQQMSGIAVRRQMKMISLRISEIFENPRNYDKCISLIDNMLKYWVGTIKKNIKVDLAVEMEKLVELDLQFYKYTIFTHRGDVDGAGKCEEICDEIISSYRKINFETLEYMLKYTNRKIIQKINRFDFEGALEDSDALVRRCENIKAAIDLSESGILFDELGKALGTRAQIHMYMIRKDKAHFEKAKEDAERAKEEFDNEVDRRRQDLYLAQIYSEVGQFDEAYRALFGEMELGGLEDWLAIQKNSPYEIFAYLRLMAEGKLKRWAKADKLYEAFCNTSIENDMKNDKEMAHPHPRECIFWKLGTYYANANNAEAAHACYEEALKCCEKDKDSSTLPATLFVIGCAIALERYAYLLKNKDSNSKKIKKLSDHLRSIHGNISKDMREIYRGLSFGGSDWKYFYDNSRKVTY